ncbi:arylsulfatase [Robiginitalea aurantiaca]|uniref:Arylsulfatase n=1 Tax=Robiginitalea aurantiaca TaxID=3056915 RepID=A0ABT7WH76_9FLAO|nr:arylsulfatase [Robiginitalea aurantiaca]MDM9632169.1 arylsulfatase [Robiginitalea aurantiaca]
MRRTLLTAILLVFFMSFGRAQEKGKAEFKGKIGTTLAESEEYWPEPVKAPEGAPNVLIWLIDDMGYGHSSAFGGLTPMPTIERLANKGLRYNNFHTTALCSPSRASIAAGRNHHNIGMGSHSLTAMGFPGYNAHPPESAKGFSEILKREGWSTMFIGKWDHTPQWESTFSGPFDRWPSGDGWEHFYGFMSGDMNNFNPIMWTDHTPMQPNYDQPGYHVNEDMANTAINWISMLKASDHDKPFCMFWATGAVHAPHQAPKNWVEKFKGKFSMGYDKAREIILNNQIEMGIVPKGTKLSPRDETIPAWNTLNEKEKALYERQMEAFAGQLSYTDYEFGRVLDYLENIGELDNTVVIFTSDNGGSGEGGLHGTFNENGFFNGVPNIPYETNAQYINEWGNKVGVWHVTAGWTQAGNTPFQYYKQSAHRGGNADALVISWPEGIDPANNGQVRDQYHHIIDIAPTILEAAGVEAPEVIDGVKQMPFDGVPMNYSFNQPKAEDTRTVQYYELFGNRGIYADGWTAVTLHRGKRPWVLNAEGTLADDKWELYNLKEDFSQSNDLAAKYPDKLEELKRLFEEEARKNNVYPLDGDVGPRLAKMQARAAPQDKELVYWPPAAIRVHESVAPPLKNKSHELVAEVEVPKGGANGMLVTAGGRTSGYAFMVLDNQLVYVYNYIGDRTVIMSSEDVPEGKSELKMVFTSTGQFQGDAELFINGKSVGKARIPKTIPATYSIEETFDVGQDTGSPIIEDTYAVPFKNESLQKLTVRRLD